MNGSPQRLILRNTVLLVGAQVIVAPLAMVINAVAARTLGAADFGQLYIATTFSSFALLIVEWGQATSLTAMVARDRSRAGELLGSGLALRACLLVLVFLACIAGCALAGYDRRFLGVLLLVLLAAAFGTIAAACQAVLRGFERSEVVAASVILGQVLTTLVVLPTLLLVGGLRSFLVAQAVLAAIMAAPLLWVVLSLGVPRLSVRRTAGIGLLRVGTSFLLFNLVVALQSNLDVVFLSKLASPEAIGWQAVARKLTGVLIFPAAALSSALYPTLSRLCATDQAAFRAVAADVLRTVPVIAMPIGLGCVLFPQIGTNFFGHDAFGAANDNIRILGLFVFLLFVTVPLSTTLLVAGRQRIWAGAQCGCVVLSALLDPILIPYFQKSTGNGGLGVCISNVVSEMLMLAAGLYLLPRDLSACINWRVFGPVASAGVVMTVCARLLHGINAYAAAAAATAAYAVCLWLSGGLKKKQIDLFLSLFRSNRAPAAAKTAQPAASLSPLNDLS